MEELAKELSALMDEIEQEFKDTGKPVVYNADLFDEEQEQDPRLWTIGNLRIVVSALAPELLDKRFHAEEEN